MAKDVNTETVCRCSDSRQQCTNIGRTSEYRCAQTIRDSGPRSLELLRPGLGQKQREQMGHELALGIAQRQ